MPKPVHRNATRTRQNDPPPPMSADEAMDILSGYHQRAVARIMAAEAAQAAQAADAVKPVNAAKETLQHEQ